MVDKFRSSVLLVVLISVCGSFLRLYKLQDTLMFQADQGRDAIVVKKMIKDFDLTLIGPVTSVGNMYLGPFYYYFMAPFLWLTYPNPVGPAYGVAILNILGMLILFKLAKEMFGELAAKLSLLVYAFLAVAVISSRFSWNPNIAPFFSIVLTYGLHQALTYKRYKYLLLAWIAMAVITQSHYVGLLMLPVILTMTGYMLIKRKKQRRVIILNSLGGIAIYLVSFTPLIMFDIRHEQLIRKGFVEFFTSDEEHIRPINKIVSVVKEAEGVSFWIMARLTTNTISPWIDRMVTYGGLALLGVFVYLKKIILKKNYGLGIVGFSLLITIVGISFYSSATFNHYASFIFPILALYWGLLLSVLWKSKYVGKISVVLLLGLFIWINYHEINVFNPTGPSIDFYKKVASNILVNIGEGPYNLALLAENRDYKAMNYRYFLEISDHPPKSHEDYSDLDRLVVIDEIQYQDPLSVEIYEIQATKLNRLVNMFPIYNGPKIYIYGKE